MPKEPKKYTAIRDTREGKNKGWFFPEGDRCLGTDTRTVKTGDYTLEGMESTFTIERKASTGEMAGCIFQPRFQRELVRMDAMDYPYLFLEFDMADVVSFPKGSGVPKDKWGELRMTPQLLMKLLHELQLDHPKIHVWMVGRDGAKAASSLFKRMIDRHG